MGEVLLTVAFVAAVFGLPTLIGVWLELRRERKLAEQREQQRRFEEARREPIRRSDGALGSPPLTGYGRERSSWPVSSDAAVRSLIRFVRAHLRNTGTEEDRERHRAA